MPTRRRRIEVTSVRQRTTLEEDEWFSSPWNHAEDVRAGLVIDDGRHTRRQTVERCLFPDGEPTVSSSPDTGSSQSESNACRLCSCLHPPTSAGRISAKPSWTTASAADPHHNGEVASCADLLRRGLPADERVYDRFENTPATLADAGGRHSRRLSDRHGGLRGALDLRTVPGADDGRPGLEPGDLCSCPRHPEPHVGDRDARRGGDRRPVRPPLRAGRRNGRVCPRHVGYGGVQQRHRAAVHRRGRGGSRGGLHRFLAGSGGDGPSGGTRTALAGTRTRYGGQFARPGSVLTGRSGIHHRVRVVHRPGPPRRPSCW